MPLTATHHVRAHADLSTLMASRPEKNMAVRHLVALLLGVFLIAGCGSMSPDKWEPRGEPMQLRRDSYECENEATRTGSAWLDASPLWRAGLGRKATWEIYDDCMRLRGYQERSGETAAEPERGTK